LPYAASKAALAAATRSLALEFGHHKIRVNSLHCGAILNDALFENLDALAERNGTTRDAVYAQIASMNALGFIATPEEHMGSVLYLLSDLSKPVTGISLHVNSGRFMT
jgi:NAD(P)-dependent dehydrogenase (short-subunit alcohol dehydrogenase family)